MSQSSLLGHASTLLNTLLECKGIRRFVFRWSLLLCSGFSLVVPSGGYSLVMLHGLLIAVTSLVVKGGL